MSRFGVGKVPMPSSVVDVLQLQTSKVPRGKEKSQPLHPPEARSRPLNFLHPPSCQM